MTKIRVYELAKELNKTSRDVMAALKKMGHPVESHRSLVPDGFEDKIRNTFSSSKPEGDSKEKNSEITLSTPVTARTSARTSTRSATRSGAGAAGRTSAGSSSAGTKAISRGMIDSRGNFVMDSDFSRDNVRTSSKSEPAARRTTRRTTGQTSGTSQTRRNVSGSRNVQESQAVKTSSSLDNKAAASRKEELKSENLVKLTDPSVSETKMTSDLNKEAANEAKAELKAEVKAEEKIEAKAEVKAEEKTEAKAEVKAEEKTEAKAEVKPEAKPEVKTEVKPEVNSEAKEEVKPEAKTELKSEAKEVAKAEFKSEAKEIEKAEVQPAAKTEEKPEIKADLKSEARAEVRTEAGEDKAEVKPEEKSAVSAENMNRTAAATASAEGEKETEVKREIQSAVPVEEVSVEPEKETVMGTGKDSEREVTRESRGENRDRRNDRSQSRDHNSHDRRDNNRNTRQGSNDENGQKKSYQNRNNSSRNSEGGSYSRNSDNRNSEGRNNRTGSSDGRSFNNRDKAAGESRNGDGANRNRQGGQSRPFNRDNRDNNRDFRDRDNRDNNRDNNRGQGSQGQNRQGGTGKRFNMNSAIKQEVVPAKDAVRDSRKGRKENKERDLRKNDHDFEEMSGSRKNAHGSKNNRNNNNNNSNFSHGKDHKKPGNAPKPAPVVEKVTSIELPESITVADLAALMKIPAAQIIKKQFLAGNIYTMNTELSYEEAEEIAIDYDILCEHEVVVDVIEEMLKDDEDDEESLVSRPPVVCVMGHVDHGKTSILDAIRNTHVTSGEAGGITQHIGAYVVNIRDQKITFLDTPGHEAFTAMRLRGAQSTDIAILVVAADDGVMPQTVEAINHAKAAGIDIIVAINKIDKPGANVDRVKQELMEYELISEDWGGKTIMVPVSAHTGEGLDDLLDMIILDAEMLDLKANPNRKGRGLVLEAQLDKGRGAVATVLVQKGTLHVGDNVSCGTAYGKIRAMIDDKGRRVKAATPSTPVEILGLNAVPQSGDVFIVTESEKEARAMAETFIASNREKLLQETKSKLSLESLFDQIKEGQIKELNIVVKADVQGSVEAVKQSLVKLSNDEVAVKVIHGGVGAINESDVILASASNAIVIGFNVRPDNQAKTTAELENVDIRLYRVIYNAIEDIEAAMKGMLEPEFREKIIGHAEVRQTYRVSGVGTIIGGYVTDGQITRSCKARLIRDNVVLYDGDLGSLKRFKDDVKEVNSGFEFGMSFEKYNDIKEGDQIEAYVMEEIPR